MDRRFRRKIWQIEKKVAKVKAHKQEQWDHLDFTIIYDAREHAARVAAIVLKGEPKVDEPLIRAHERALERLGMDESMDLIGDYLFIELTRGDDEEFAKIFDQAPLWLLHFTTIALDAFLLKFNLPNLSAPIKWGVDGIKDARRWPQLPIGTMSAGRPVSEQVVVDLSRLSADDCLFMCQLGPEEEWSTAESDRHNTIWSRLHKLRTSWP